MTFTKKLMANRKLFIVLIKEMCDTKTSFSNKKRNAINLLFDDIFYFFSSY